MRGQEAMAEVRKATGLRMSTNMCVTRFEHVPDAIRLKPIDVVLADHHYWGGMVGCQELGRLCETLGWGVSQHSNNHAGITMAAMIHLGAVVPQLTYASDTHYPWLVEGSRHHRRAEAADPRRQDEGARRPGPGRAARRRPAGASARGLPQVRHARARRRHDDAPGRAGLGAKTVLRHGSDPVRVAANRCRPMQTAPLRFSPLLPITCVDACAILAITNAPMAGAWLRDCWTSQGHPEKLLRHNRADQAVALPWPGDTIGGRPRGRVSAGCLTPPGAAYVLFLVACSLGDPSALRASSARVFRVRRSHSSNVHRTCPETGQRLGNGSLRTAQHPHLRPGPADRGVARRAVRPAAAPGAAGKGLKFRPEVYLTDSWGCPDEVPVIGIPFYLTDKRLARIEEEQTGEIEDSQILMMLLRHEAGHAINYAYRLYKDPEWVRGVRPVLPALPRHLSAEPVQPAVRPAPDGTTSTAGPTRRSTRTRTSPRRSRSG